MEVLLEEEVPVFASGLGTPKPFADALHANGTTDPRARRHREGRASGRGGRRRLRRRAGHRGGRTHGQDRDAPARGAGDRGGRADARDRGGRHRDGRTLAAALALGAEAAWCGTAFLVSNEANQPALQKQRILAASAEDTVITRLYSGKTMRNITNPLIEAWEREGLQALPMGAQGALIRDLQYSIEQAGRHELLMNAAGQMSGVLTQQRPAAEILAEMVAEAAELLTDGLAKRVRVSR
jgi:NAD(P)H-dependent flavin oxidoreductase YrpB (nitropropane dioxygenase family)